jgi:hypothetical protein
VDPDPDSDPDPQHWKNCNEGPGTVPHFIATKHTVLTNVVVVDPRQDANKKLNFQSFFAYYFLSEGYIYISLQR